MSDRSTTIKTNPLDPAEVTDESLVLLRRIVKLLESSAVVDANMRQRVAVESFPGALVGVQSTTVAAGVPGTNQVTAFAPSAASQVVYMPVWVGPVDQRFQIMDAARNAYANGIRSNLIFS